jgi:uncharacterized membrane protein
MGKFIPKLLGMKPQPPSDGFTGDGYQGDGNQARGYQGGGYQGGGLQGGGSMSGGYKGSYNGNIYVKVAPIKVKVRSG